MAKSDDNWFQLSASNTMIEKSTSANVDIDDPSIYLSRYRLRRCTLCCGWFPPPRLCVAAQSVWSNQQAVFCGVRDMPLSTRGPARVSLNRLSTHWDTDTHSGEKVISLPHHARAHTRTHTTQQDREQDKNYPSTADFLFSPQTILLLSFLHPAANFGSIQ